MVGMLLGHRDLGEEFDASSGRGEYANRSTLLFTVAALLKQYADEFQLLVVVSNQVSVVSHRLLIPVRRSGNRTLNAYVEYSTLNLTSVEGIAYLLIHNVLLF